MRFEVNKTAGILTDGVYGGERTAKPTGWGIPKWAAILRTVVGGLYDAAA